MVAAVNHRVVLLLLAVSSCAPRLTAALAPTDFAALAARQRAVLEAGRACADEWSARHFTDHEKAMLSNASLERWLRPGADGGVDSLATPVTPHPDERLTRVARAIAGPARASPFTPLVVDEARADAFALPDDRLLVTSGLMAAATTDGQLAGVVAHELAHLVAGDALKVARIKGELVCRTNDLARLQAAELNRQGHLTPDAGAALGTMTNELAARLAESVATLAYGPKQEAKAHGEREADRAAAMWMHGAGYDIREFEAVLEKLNGMAVPHPTVAERIATLEEVRRSLPPAPSAPAKKPKR